MASLQEAGFNYDDDRAFWEAKNLCSHAHVLWVSEDQDNAVAKLLLDDISDQLRRAGMGGRLAACTTPAQTDLTIERRFEIQDRQFRLTCTRFGQGIKRRQQRDPHVQSHHLAQRIQTGAFKIVSQPGPRFVG